MTSKYYISQFSLILLCMLKALIIGTNVWWCITVPNNYVAHAEKTKTNSSRNYHCVFLNADTVYFFSKKT